MATDIQTVRRRNLRRYISERGTNASVAATLGLSNGTFLSQLLGPNPTRAFSEKLARKFEPLLGLLPGTLDLEVNALGVTTKAITDDDVARVVQLLTSAVDQAGVKPTPEQMGDMSRMFTEHLRLTGSLEPEFAERMVRLLK